MIDQLRDGTYRQIAENPTIITPYRRPLVSDDFGGLAPDPTGTLTAQPLARVRLSHESSSVPANRPMPSGLDTNLSLYVLTDYHAPLQDGDVFNAEGRGWKVGPINTLKIEGYTYATEAPITPADTVPITIPHGFAVAAISDTEIDVVWDDVGAVNTYSVERKTGAAAFAVVASPVAGAKIFHDTGRTPLTTYTYRMRALSASVHSLYTPEVNATTEATP
jgi:hypothetical protein